MLDKLVSQYKKVVTEEETPRPSQSTIARFENQFSSTRAIMSKVLSQYLVRKDQDLGDDEIVAEGVGGLFSERLPSSSDRGDSGIDPGPGSRKSRPYKKIPSPSRKRTRKPPGSQYPPTRLGTPTPRPESVIIHSVSGMSIQSKGTWMGMEHLSLSQPPELTSILELPPIPSTSRIEMMEDSDDAPLGHPDLLPLGPMTALESPTAITPRETRQRNWY